jgi:uncharacterized membrane protein YeaQ/YmgE (transglycosylase-associated protein family)
MSRLSPTLEELKARQADRLADQAEREARWHQRQRHFITKATWSGGLLLLATARFAAIGGGGLSWPAWILLPATGALLAWLIARSGWGILRGLLVYGLGSFATWWLCQLLGWWGLAGDRFSVMGSVALTMMAWLSWLVIGGFIGMFSSQFDDDNRQI